MPTYNDIVKGALKHISVGTAESPLTPDEAQDGLSDLNDMLSAWEVGGLALGFIPVTDINSVAELPDGAIGAIKASLAMRLAPQYGKIVSPSLIELIRTSFNDVLVAYAPHINVQYPDTLPMGSGNECPGLLDNVFFPVNQKQNF